MSNKPFTELMREATRKAHSKNDALVNYKLCFGVTNEQVWFEGILVFGEIFEALEKYTFEEQGVLKNFSSKQIGLSFASAFDEDLKKYFGNNWREIAREKPSVVAYLNHLKLLSDAKPVLLLAHIYHLYLGLLSGGQLLKKLFSIRILGSKNAARCSIINMELPVIMKAKSKIKNSINEIAITLEDSEIAELLVESDLVFFYNQALIESIDSAKKIFVKRLLTSASALIVISYLVKRLFF